MHRTLRWATLMACLLTLLGSASAQDLPASDWYAVVWVLESDTLHWLTAEGEVASLPRPRLPAESNPTLVRLHISPNGETALLIAPQWDGRESIGVYNFAAGRFVQIHTTQANEIVQAGRAVFTPDSQHAVLALRTRNTGDWRMIAFDSVTGDATHVLARLAPTVPLNFIRSSAWQPHIGHLSLDAATDTLEAHFQLLPPANERETLPAAFRWRIPATGSGAQVVADAVPYTPDAGFAVHPETGTTLYAQDNALLLQATPNTPPQEVAAAEGTLSQPLWLNDGAWIGYLHVDDMLQWVVTRADGEGAQTLAPELTALFGTRDGYLAQDVTGATLYHSTTLAFDGATPLFESAAPFVLLYSTPPQTAFTLARLPDASS